MDGATERAEKLRAAGLKATAPRLAILGALEANRRHPSAEELHRVLAASHPSVSLSTVYLTLEAFVRAGLVRKMPEVDGRLRVDGVTDDHDHAICRRCGTIFDVSRREFPLPPPPLELVGGLAVLGVRVEYDVHCAACRDGDDAPRG